jgi:SprT protein
MTTGGRYVCTRCKGEGCLRCTGLGWVGGHVLWIERQDALAEAVAKTLVQKKIAEVGQVIVVEWNRRFTKRLGDGGYNPVTFQSKIRLSVPLWPRASEQDRRETVIHEACHVIVGFKHGVAAAHGYEWKESMKNCGVEPLRTHSVDRTGLIRRHRRYILCDCPNEGIEKKCRITAREYNLVRRGKEYWCKVCGLHLDQNASIEEDRKARLQKL